MSRFISSIKGRNLGGAFSKFLGPLATAFDPSKFGTVIARHSAQFAVGFSDGDPVNTVPDHGGIAGAQTAATTARPTFKANAINGLPALTYDGAANVMKTAVVTNGIGHGDWWLGMILRATSLAGSGPIFCIGVGAGLDYQRSGDKLRADRLDSSGPFVSDPGAFVLNTWVAVELYVESGVGHFAINGVVDPNSISVSDALTDGALLSEGGSTLTADFYTGDIADKLFIKSHTNRSALSAAWRKIYGLPLAVAFILFVGNSLFAGTQVDTPQRIPAQMQTILETPPTTRIYEGYDNQGVNGQTIQGMIDNEDSQVWARISDTADYNLILTIEGTNQIHQGSTAMEAVALMEQYFADLTGGNIRLGTATFPLGLNASADDEQFLIWNDYLRNNWRAMGADFFFDWAADPRMQDPAYRDPDDKFHMSALGNTAAAEGWAAAIQALPLPLPVPEHP